jgi:hypothetical protein
MEFTPFYFRNPTKFPSKLCPSCFEVLKNISPWPPFPMIGGNEIQLSQAKKPSSVSSR